MEFSNEVIIGCVASLCGIIGVFWKREKDRTDKLEKKLDELSDKHIDLTGDFREIKGQIDVIVPVNKSIESITESIESTSGKMLEELRNIRVNNDT